MPGGVLHSEPPPPYEGNIDTLSGEKPQLDIDSSGKYVSVAYLCRSCLFPVVLHSESLSQSEGFRLISPTEEQFVLFCLLNILVHKICW